MRKIGELNSDKLAQHFGHYLSSIGIENQIEEAEGNRWIIWVLSEDQVAQATQDFAKFKNNPINPAFLSAAVREFLHGKLEETTPPTPPPAPTTPLPTSPETEEPETGDRYPLKEVVWFASAAKITLFLVLVSIVVAILTKLGKNEALMQWLVISKSNLTSDTAWWQILPEVRSGQIWRLVTPIFINYSIFPIVMTSLWMLELSVQIENWEGKLFFLFFVLAIAIISNIAQYLLSGPQFGGTTAIAFASLSFIWIRKRREPLVVPYSWGGATAIVMVTYAIANQWEVFGPTVNAHYILGFVLGLVAGLLFPQKKTP